MLVAAKLAGLLLTPPGVILLLALIGFLLRLRWPRLGIAAIGCALGALLVLSVPLTGYLLLTKLESDIPPLAEQTPDALRRRADAIVVLGGGRVVSAGEYGGDTVSSYTLERLRYAARLQRASGLPVLLSGGAPFGEKIPEAEMMRRTLEQDFGVRAKWMEDRSRSTYENAIYTKAVLAGTNVRRVLVVTHAWHAPRAAWAFARAGLDATIAPTLYTHTNDKIGVLDYFPTAHGLSLSSRAISEWLGLRWYQLRGVPRTELPPAEPAAR